MMKKKRNFYTVLISVALLVIVVLFLLDPSRTQATNGTQPTNEAQATNGTQPTNEAQATNGTQPTNETQSEPDADPIIEQSLAYYFDKVGEEVDKDKVEAVRKSFGCHFEIHIYYEGEVVMKLGYYDGQVYEV